jgi:hypothetical protein
MYGKENYQAIFGSKPIEMKPYSHMFGDSKGEVTFRTSKNFQKDVYCNRN